MRILTVPNLLTGSRLALLPVVIVLYQQAAWAFFVRFVMLNRALLTGE